MRPSARSAICPDTGHPHVFSSRRPSHTDMGNSNFSPLTTRGTHPVAAVNLDCPRLLRCSAIQDSTTGRSLSRVAGSLGKMILTYTWLDFGRASFFGVGFCAFTAYGTTASALTTAIEARTSRVITNLLTPTRNWLDSTLCHTPHTCHDNQNNRYTLGRAALAPAHPRSGQSGGKRKTL